MKNDTTIEPSGGVSWSRLEASVGEALLGLDREIATLVGWMRRFLGEVAEKRSPDDHQHQHDRQTIRVRSSGLMLVTGESGTGKSALIETLARCSGWKWSRYHGSSVHKPLEGESEQNLIDFFQTHAFDASTTSAPFTSTPSKSPTPTLVIIEDLDVLAPRIRESDLMKVERKVTSQLVHILDRIQRCNELRKTSIVVVAITSRLDSVDLSLLRPSRFELVLRLPIPSPESRLSILKHYFNLNKREIPMDHLHQSGESLERVLMEISDRTHGYVGADLENLCREAINSAAQRLQQQQQTQQTTPPFIIDAQDFENALQIANPSLLRDALGSSARTRVNKNTTTRAGDNPSGGDVLASMLRAFDDLAGIERIAKDLLLSVVLPLRRRHVLKRIVGIASPPRGILLYGPPGTGKTSLALCLAQATGVNLIGAFTLFLLALLYM